jgi:pyruvate dehydrogenase E2 component (dihydrolipoamide acetyltransferase)
VTVEIVVPQIGEAVAELTLTTWLKKEGDVIQKGDVLFEIDSDKAIVEVEAFVDGTLVEILAPAGSAVMPQQVVARLRTDDEKKSKLRTQPITPIRTDSYEGKDNLRISPVAQRMAADLHIDLDDVTGTGPNGRITTEDIQRLATQEAEVMPKQPVVTQEVQIDRTPASPKAKRLAQERGLDLAELTGTGVDGLIIARDVEGDAPLIVPAPPAEAGEILPLGKLRQRIAERTQASKQQIPHFYVIVDVEMTAINKLRDYCAAKLGWERPPTYTDILIRACALAIESMPDVNRSYRDAGLIERESVNIGVAVSSAAGLVVPVIPDAPSLDLKATAETLRGLTERARSGRLRLADLSEKSMVISNLGMYTVDAFIAIIDMPDPMILAVGRVADRVVAVDGQPVVRSMCTLSLSVDHRVMDGVPAAQFLEAVKDRLEQPYEILGGTGGAS